MPILLNGEVVPQELVLSEERRLREAPGVQAVQDQPDFPIRLRQTAEFSAMDIVR
jgi:hypothetical protein